MNICVLSKYPPVEGGVASTTYWFVKALGEMGHKIHVITNAQEVESDYREEIDGNEIQFLEPKNVKVHNISKHFKSPILKSSYYTDRLVSLTLDVIKENKIDIIYSFYLLPYGVAGMFAKLITGKPFIVRNAGSDIGRLYNSKSLKSLLGNVLLNANWIHGAGGILKVLNEENISHNKIIKFGHGTINPSFNPKVKPFNFSHFTKKKIKKNTIFTFIGKIQKIKGIDNLIKALSILKDEKFTMIFVSGNDTEVRRIKELVKKRQIEDKCIFINFQAPWKIPSIINASDCVVLPEMSEFPMLPLGVHYPIIGREVMACGKCMIIGRGIASRGYYKKLTKNKNAIITDSGNIKDLASKLLFVIKNPEKCKEIGANAYKLSRQIENFELYYKKVSLFLNNIN